MLFTCVSVGIPDAGSLVARIALVGLPTRASRVVFIIVIVVIIILDHILQLLELSLLANSGTIIFVIVYEVILVIKIIIRLKSFAACITTIFLSIGLVLILRDIVHHIILGLHSESEFDLILDTNICSISSHDMRCKRRLDNHLAADLPFQELELRVLCETVGSMHSLGLNLKDLVANNQGLSSIAPLYHLGVTLHLKDNIS